jgi:methylglutaconyl-CoA hydratase
MGHDHILYEIQTNNIATITLNKPEKHNAFDDAIIESLTETLTTINNEPTIRMVILKAHGKNFCAGADLGWMQRMASYNEAENLNDSIKLARLMQTLYSLSKPTIVLVQGAAIGGGVGLVACCDIAIAANNASFCLSEVKIGLIPAVISPYVIQAMGARAARRYFLTAEKFSANTAYQLGLVHEIVPFEQLETVANEFSQLILQNSPSAISSAKQLIHDVTAQPITDELIQDTAKRIAAIRVSPEGQAGLKAFLTKQPAPWCSKK